MQHECKATKDINGKALKPEDRNGHRSKKEGGKGIRSLEEDAEADRIIEGGPLEEDVLVLEEDEMKSEVDAFGDPDQIMTVGDE